MTRQNYYKHRSIRQRRRVDEALVLDLVRRERARQPMLGGRKLRHLIEPELRAAEVSLGRDRFFELLRREDLLIRRRKKAVRTTDSRHGYRVYPNRAKDLVPRAPHRLWVSDLTYLRTEEGFLYLALVMDAWSRTIVGYDCSDSLEMEGALRALTMALAQRPSAARASSSASSTMHHSDRGVQHCCRAYIEELQRAEVAISMTEANHCYENSRAERLNGTLKREYGLGSTFVTKAEVVPVVREAVTLYNEHRPHQALGYRTPLAVHQSMHGTEPESEHGLGHGTEHGTRDGPVKGATSDTADPCPAPIAAA